MAPRVTDAWVEAPLGSSPQISVPAPRERVKTILREKKQQQTECFFFLINFSFEF